MKIFSLLFLLAVSAHPAMAKQAPLQLSATFGFRSNSGDTNIQNASVTSKTSVHAGLLGILPLKYGWGARSGFMYTQRYVDIGPTLQGTVSIEFAYIDVPLTAVYRFSDAASVFAGPVIAINQSKDVNCTQKLTCTALDTKSVVVPWQAGAHFLFASDIGAEIFYEYTPGDLATSVSDVKSIGLTGFYTFE